MNDTPSEHQPLKKKRTGLKILLGIILVALALIALIPTIVSSGFGRTTLLAKVNATIDGEVGLETLRLGWMGKQRLSGISFTDVDGRPVATVKSIEISKGLLGLALSKDLGVVTVVEPVIDLPGPKPTEPVEEPSAPRSGSGGSSSPAPDKRPDAPEKSKDIQIPVSGTVKIENARIALASEPLLQNMRAEFGFGPDKPVTFEVVAKSGKSSGAVTARGHVELPKGELNLETLPVNIDLTISQFDLEPVLAWAGANPSLPRGSGLVNGRFKVTGNPLRVDGHMDVDKLAFRGGPLGGDTPSFDRVMLEVKGGLSKGVPQLDLLTFESPVLNARGSGTLETITLKADVRLPELFDRFPETLNVRKGMTIQDGRIDLACTVGFVGERKDIKSEVILSGLSGTVDRKPIQLEQPLTVVIDTALTPNGLDIRDLTLDASFAKGNAKGNLEQMTVHFDADLPGALAEAGKFIDIGGWAVKGTARLDAGIQPGESGTRKMTATLDFNDFSLAEAGLPFMTDEQVNLRLDASGDPARGVFENLSMICNAALGKVRLQAGGIRLARKDREPSIERFGFEGGFYLDRMNPLLHRFGGVPGESRINGKARFGIQGALSAGKVLVEKLDLQAENLAFDTPDQIISEKKLNLTTQAEFDLEKQALRLTGLNLTLTPGTVSIPSLRIGDLKQPLPSGAGRIDADFDIASLLKVATPKKPGKAGDQPVKTDGRLTAKIGLQPGQPMVVDVTVRNFVQTLGDGRQLKEPEITFAAKVVQDPDGERLDLPEMSFNASPIAIRGKLSLTDLNNAKNLSLIGTQTANLPKIAEYLEFFTGQAFDMQGKATRPIDVRLSLAGKKPAEIMGDALIQASVFAERMEVYGLEISNLDIPLNVTNGFTRVTIAADVNEGKVAIEPEINWKGKNPAIVFPENATVLYNVRLTDKLADALLGRIHPLFKGASVAKGTVTLKFHRFNWPLEKGEEKGSFDGVIELRGVALATSGLLGQILQIARIKEKAAEIGDKDLVFACRNGRIETDPLKLRVDGNPITIGGTIGVSDQSLQYAATIPLTRDLVGGSVARYLSTNQVVNLPIGGTATRPRISSDGLKQEVARLVKQAGAQALISGLLGGEKKKEPASPEAGQATGAQLDGTTRTNQPPTAPTKSVEEQLIDEGLKKAGKLLDGLFK